MRKPILITALLLFVFAAGAGLIGYWMILSPNTQDYSEARSIKIGRETSYPAVIDTLLAAGILKSTTSFNAMASLTGWGEQIKAGHYAIDAGASNYDLLSILRRGLQTPVRVTIPPGTSKPQVVAEAIAREMAFEATDFLAALSDPSLASALGTDTTHLFAYMLPETYFFYWLSDASSVVKKIKGQADHLIEEARQDASSPQDLSSDEVLRMAGIVEWESQHNPERPRIAGVYLNRYRNGWPLQADPTVQYAIMEKEGKKRRLFFKDYELDHPFNTYLHRGLPPGPLTNPSPSSILAVLKPEAHAYFYFVAKGDGTHIFSRTLAEHNRNAREYYRIMRERRKENQGS